MRALPIGAIAAALIAVAANAEDAKEIRWLP
jgi:hypothetical protein